MASNVESFPHNYIIMPSYQSMMADVRKQIKEVMGFVPYCNDYLKTRLGHFHVQTHGKRALVLTWMSLFMKHISQTIVYLSTWNISQQTRISCLQAYNKCSGELTANIWSAPCSISHKIWFRFILFCFGYLIFFLINMIWFIHIHQGSFTSNRTVMLFSLYQ